MGSGGTNTLLPPGKLSEPFRSERLSIRLDRKAYHWVLRLLEPDPKCLGVIWSSLTGN